MGKSAVKETEQTKPPTSRITNIKERIGTKQKNEKKDSTFLDESSRKNTR